MKTDSQDMIINVIIPVAPNEEITEKFIDLLKYLHLKLPKASKIIIASVTSASESASIYSTTSLSVNVTTTATVSTSISTTMSTSTTIAVDDVKAKLAQWNLCDFPLEFINAESGRANCLNAGVKAVRCENEYLLFVHADTIFEENSLKMLENTMKRYPASLMYFDLAFYDGHPFMKLNELGVWFRTRFLKTPFGDQCFCIRKDLFESLEGYPSDMSCGEDHMLVRKARRNKIKIIPVKSKVHTSARKYVKNGWFKTTMLHLVLWRKQIHRDRKMVNGGNIQ